jgi:hypothetical protein
VSTSASRERGRQLFPPSHPEWTNFHKCASWSCNSLCCSGSPYDIVYMFGISYKQVMTSVWIVVEAINICPQFDILYPDTIEEQRRIAAGFQAASTPGIRNCAGAIDGILIWIMKPSQREARKAGVDQKKFLCGRKHTFGLNCQAVSDCRGRILDISIKYGGGIVRLPCI